MSHFFRLIGLSVSVLMFSACGKQDSASSPTTTDAAGRVATESAVSEHVPSTVADDSVNRRSLEPAVTAASGQSMAKAALSELNLNAGVVEALQVSAQRAVTQLTASSGTSGDSLLSVPLPDSIESLRKPLAAIGKEGMLTELSGTMNAAAGEALKQSPVILSGAISNLSVQDAGQLLRGGDDAFTRYLDRTTRPLIVAQIKPLIASATESNGTVQALEAVKGALGEKNQGLVASLGALAGIKLPGADFDLDQFVADQAVNHLFAAIAVEERKLRANPQERTSELVQGLFGLLGKENLN